MARFLGNTGMLWYKAWHESKNRFVYVLLGMIALCGLLVLSYDSWHLDPARINFRGFVWQALYFRFFHASWVFSTLFLALGGLLAERQHGTALFTISLPASRCRVLLIRAAVGAGEAVITAILPAIFVSGFSLVIGRSYPVTQSLEFAALLAAGGMVFFSLGILLSTFVRGDSVPLAVGIPLIAAVYIGTRSIDALRAYNPQDLFSGAANIRPPNWAIAMPLPWTAVAVSIGIALVLLLVAVIATEKHEF